jgi:hypothetical protein
LEKSRPVSFLGRSTDRIVPEVIAHITIFRIAAMLKATRIVPMPKVLIVRIQNRQRLISADVSGNIEVRERDATWKTRDARFKRVLLRNESTGMPSQSIGKSSYPPSTLDRMPLAGSSQIHTQSFFIT